VDRWNVRSELDLGGEYPSRLIHSEQESSKFWRGSEQPIGPSQPRNKRSGEYAIECHCKRDLGRGGAAARLARRRPPRPLLRELDDHILKDIGLNATRCSAKQPGVLGIAVCFIFAKRTIMSTIEHLYAPASACPSRNAALDAGDNRDKAIALRRRVAGSSFFSAMQLLPAQRRRAMRALYAFYREVNDIADGDASRSLKQILLANWRSEIGLLFAGRPQRDVTRQLSEAVHLYGLRCDDFLAIIDGMDARTDIRAPSLAELDRYCERTAVAIGRISVRIFGETSPAGQRVAAELGRALQLTDILCDLAGDARLHRLYLPRELLHAHGIFATMPSWVLAQPRLPDVCRDLALLAEQHYAAAGEAIAACPRSTMRPAAVMLAMYSAVLHELLARGWRQLDEPIRIPAWRNLVLTMRHGLTGR
jgi:phytoene synthase